MQAFPLRATLSQQRQQQQQAVVPLLCTAMRLAGVLLGSSWMLALMAKLLWVHLRVGCQMQRVMSGHG